MHFKIATLKTVEESNLYKQDGFTLAMDKGDEIKITDLVIRPNGLDFNIGPERFLDQKLDGFEICFKANWLQPWLQP